MKLSDAVKDTLASAPGPMTPQEIRDQIKRNHPDLYGTPSHQRCVARGHYRSLDDALLAQIYVFVGTSRACICDKRSKPMKISLSDREKRPHPQLRPPEILTVCTTHTGHSAEYDKKIREILSNTEEYHDAYYRAETFSGPSLYFHQRALATRRAPMSLTHLEYVYATLASWGMQRMGEGGPKMQSFEILTQSIKALEGRIVEAQTYDFRDMTDARWTVLEEIFRKVKAMATGATLVGNSKVMHHLLPNIVPPIDREYTLWFLRGNTSLKNDPTTEWHLMKEIISRFFVPVASDSIFYSKAEQWIGRTDDFPWDTSVFKVVDNLIIGYKKFTQKSKFHSTLYP
ncbi:MAG: hypothetical protein P4L55_11415 [Syntrophobacteraceae bacterium]|nr:hypothetical protein [Syntrophobacteraceae bacterium]